MNPKLKIFIADDIKQSRFAFGQIINNIEEWEICGEISYAGGLLEAVSSYKPDVLLIDIYMPMEKDGKVDYRDLTSQNGLRQGLRIKKEYPQIGVLFTSLFVHDAAIQIIYRSKLSGGLGFIHKNADESEILHAISRVAGGHREVNFEATRSVVDNKSPVKISRGILELFTEQEKVALRQIAMGFARERASCELKMSKGLFDKHINRIRKKLEKNKVLIGGSSEYSLVHLTHLALSEGLLDILPIEIEEK